LKAEPVTDFTDLANAYSLKLMDIPYDPDSRAPEIARIEYLVDLARSTHDGDIPVDAFVQRSIAMTGYDPTKWMEESGWTLP
jgi:hypothetical protein